MVSGFAEQAKIPHYSSPFKSWRAIGNLISVTYSGPAVASLAEGIIKRPEKSGKWGTPVGYWLFK